MADDNLLWIQAVDKPYQRTRQFLCHFVKDPIHILLSFGKCIPFTFLDYFIHFLAKSPKIFHIPSYFLKLAFKYIAGNIAFQASPVSAAAWFSLPVNARMPQFTDHSTGIRIQFPIYNQSGAHTVRQIYINKILTVRSCAIIFLHDRGTVTLPIKKDWHMTMFLYFPGNFQVMQPIKIRRCQDLTPILIHRPDCADSNPVYLLISQCFHNLIQCMKDVLHQLRCCLFSYRKTNLF